VLREPISPEDSGYFTGQFRVGGIDLLNSKPANRKAASPIFELGGLEPIVSYLQRYD